MDENLILNKSAARFDLLIHNARSKVMFDYLNYLLDVAEYEKDELCCITFISCYPFYDIIDHVSFYTPIITLNDIMKSFFT